jgi:hypothetical protein
MTDPEKPGPNLASRRGRREIAFWEARAAARKKFAARSETANEFQDLGLRLRAIDEIL